MADVNTALTGWNTWSLSTRLVVVGGLLLAAALVVVLYVPR